MGYQMNYQSEIRDTGPPASPSGETASAGAVRASQAHAGPINTRASLSRLVVTNFRSYVRAELQLDARPVVLTGDNGAGKTNLLEAVSLLSPGRGLRGASFAELARVGGTGGWAVAATVEAGDNGGRGSVTIGTGITAPPRNTHLEGAAENEPAPAPDEQQRRARLVKLDGQTLAGPAKLAELVQLVWLTPAMDRLFMESAGARRRFLDRLVMGFDPGHGSRANAYEKALRERNRLLAENIRDDAWLTALEEQMAEHGVALAAARIETVARLKGAIEAGATMDTSAFPRAGLALEGTLEAALANTAAVDLEDRFRAALAAARPRDGAAGRTLEGPHRSDLLVRHSAKNNDARICSTGEQKALLIGIIMAHARLISARDKAVPILLLDEIAAHLDKRRRAALFDEIAALGLQAWMTGTDPNLFETLAARAQYFHVADGGIMPVERFQ